MKGKERTKVGRREKENREKQILSNMFRLIRKGRETLKILFRFGKERKENYLVLPTFLFIILKSLICKKICFFRKF